MDLHGVVWEPVYGDDQTQAVLTIQYMLTLEPRINVVPSQDAKDIYWRRKGIHQPRA